MNEFSTYRNNYDYDDVKVGFFVSFSWYSHFFRLLHSLENDSCLQHFKLGLVYGLFSGSSMENFNFTHNYFDSVLSGSKRFPVTFEGV